MKLHVCNQAWIVFIVLSLFASPLYIGHVLTPAAREQIRELLLHVSCIEAIQLDRLFHAAFCHIAEGARVRSQRPVSVTSGSVSMRQSACLLLAPIDRKCAWQHHDLGHARLCHCRLRPAIDAPGHRQCPVPKLRPCIHHSPNLAKALAGVPLASRTNTGSSGFAALRFL
jgi:hypothetical protein